MGCQNSQVNDLAPQPPHVLDQEGPQHQTPPPCSPQTPQLHQQSDKENLTPPSKPPTKQGLPIEYQGTPKEPQLDQNRKKSKSEKMNEDINFFDSTNCPKEKPALQEPAKKEQRRESKVLSARSSYHPEENDVGPSSKSIPPHQEPQATGEEGFPITKVLKEGSAPSLKVPPEQNVVREEGCVSEKAAIEPFVLEQWEGTTPRKGTEEEKELLKEQVTNYLEQLWKSKKEVVDAVVSKLEEEQMKRYEERP